MKAKKIAKKIIRWETLNGESFNDYFSHDTINDYVWAGFLIGKGFVEHGNLILEAKKKASGCLDQELLYNIYPEYTGSDEFNWHNFENNVFIMSEFISKHWEYLDEFKKFLVKESG